MFKLRIQSAKTTLIGNRSGMLRFCLLLVFSAILASSTQPPDPRLARKTVSLPRNYCSADVASLGTGLVQASVSSGTNSGVREYRRWTGWIRAAAYGKYEFSLPVSGGRVLVNQQQIFSRSKMSAKPAIIQIQLDTNRFYAITVETSSSEDSTPPLHWQRPDGRYEIVPKAYLYAPMATVRTGDKNMTEPNE